MTHLFPIQNSIRHNLSLHSRFVRIQNEGTGKSSWWMLNPEGGKSGKSPRRRAASMDNNSKFAKSRGRATKKKVKPPFLFIIATLHLPTHKVNLHIASPYFFITILLESVLKEEFVTLENTLHPGKSSSSHVVTLAAGQPGYPSVISQSNQSVVVNSDIRVASMFSSGKRANKHFPQNVCTILITLVSFHYTLVILTAAFVKTLMFFCP